MTREDIIRMAREAKLLGEFDTEECIVQSGIEIWLFGERGINELIQFAALVASAEREACAKACEDAITNDWEGAVQCAKDIRARGQT